MWVVHKAGRRSVICVCFGPGWGVVRYLQIFMWKSCCKNASKISASRNRASLIVWCKGDGLRGEELRAAFVYALCVFCTFLHIEHMNDMECGKPVKLPFWGR